MAGLQVVYERCAGCDVHKKTVVVHVVVPGRSEARTFGTTTRDLLTLLEWSGGVAGDARRDGKHGCVLEAAL